MAQKRKVSITLDEDLVAALEGGDATLSAQVNAVPRLEMERRGREQLLHSGSTNWRATDGPVDEVLVATFEEMLS